MPDPRDLNVDEIDTFVRADFELRYEFVSSDEVVRGAETNAKTLA